MAAMMSCEHTLLLMSETVKLYWLLPENENTELTIVFAILQEMLVFFYRVPETTPRLLINMEKCGQEVDFFAMLMGRKSGFQFDHAENYRDVMWQGTTDDGCVALANLLGWKDELLKLHKLEHERINEAAKMTKDAGLTKVK